MGAAPVGNSKDAKQRIMKTFIITLLLCSTACAQWDAGAWGPPLVPKRGATHTTNSFFGARERACPCRVQAIGGGGVGDSWNPLHIQDLTDWEVTWGRGFIGGFDLQELYRSQRDMLVNQKFIITNMLGNAIYPFADTNYCTVESGELTFTVHLNLSNEIPLLTKESVLTYVGAPSDYFTETPYRALFDSENGWKYIKPIYNLMVATLVPVSWTNSVLCTNINNTSYGPSVTQTNFTNSVSGDFTDITPPEDHYGWWLFNDDDTCPYLEVGWPSVDWATAGCSPASPTADGAPLYTAFLNSDIDFRQRAEYITVPPLDCDSTNWLVVLFSGNNAQNSYDVGASVRASDPMVTNQCVMQNKSVQFYAQADNALTGQATGIWAKVETVAGDTNHFIVGSQYDPSAALIEDIDTAIGACDGCWPANTNLAGSAIIVSAQFSSGTPPTDETQCFQPPFPEPICWDGPTLLSIAECVWTNTTGITITNFTWAQTCAWWNVDCFPAQTATNMTIAVFSNDLDTAFNPIGGYTRMFFDGDCLTESNWCDEVINIHPTTYGVVTTTSFQVATMECITEADYDIQVTGADLLQYTNAPTFLGIVWSDVPGGMLYTNGNSSL